MENHFVLCCHPSFWKHNSLLSCRSKSTSVDLDPCVPLSLPINKLEMSYVWEKNSLFVLLQAAKHTKNSKCTQQRGLFLMEIDTKGQLLTKLQKSKHFKAEFVMTEFMGSKVKRNRVGDYLCYNAYRQKYQKAPDTLQLFFWGKKVFWTASHMHSAVLWSYLLSRVEIKICYGYPSKLFFKRK